MVGRICGTGVSSLEWKKEEVMDGVTVVTDNERALRNEGGIDQSIYGKYPLNPQKNCYKRFFN